jgi:hypothetical protein
MKPTEKETKVPLPPCPPHLRLRAFAFDPILSNRIKTYDINEVTIKLPWPDHFSPVPESRNPSAAKKRLKTDREDENHQLNNCLRPGPVDDYLEVVDYDPTTKDFYAPVDLSDKHLLAQDGLPPSEGNPQFHQQMVYAVARTTIQHFEKALGRRALWSPRRLQAKGKEDGEFVEHLRIYPHALREANAYYSPVKKALLFGYFPASVTDPGENLPGGMVFACLSHDVVAHETTHALLDGLHPRFIEPTNWDIWALHEAFADIVALFQHFTYPEVLRHQIARTRGDLETQNLLAELAHQFGQAIERYGPLRSALAERDEDTGEWKRKEPVPEDIYRITEPHQRGAILVAAVFDAFLTIYKRRTADLLRIATGGSGVLPPGELHPDLVNRLAQEAAKASGHILNICIRALDYCPPVDVDFGDYLRAMITADKDLVTDDRYNYRLAIIEAFRQRGIYPHDVRSLSEESLLWKRPDEEDQEKFEKLFGNGRLKELVPDWGLITDRKEIFEQAKKSRKMLHEWFAGVNGLKAAAAANLVLKENAPPTYYRPRGRKDGLPALEVHSVRPARRIGPDGQIIRELVVEITQRRRGYYDRDTQVRADKGKIAPPNPDFIFRGGCTLLVNQDTAKVTYSIYKRIESKNRLNRMRSFLTGEKLSTSQSAYFGSPQQEYFRGLIEEDGDFLEPFALLHRSFQREEVK